MLEIKNTKITNYEDEQKARGTGQLVSRRKLETKSFYDKMYNKFKLENLYLDDDMWSQAATRGELDQLIFGLNTSKDGNKYLDMLSDFGDKVDYDTYMLALAIPNLDNTTKKTRLNEDGTYSFGDMTDLEWAEKVLESTKNRYTAEAIEENKDTMTFWQKAGTTILSLAGHLAKGVVNWASNTYNLGEGIVYAFDPNKTFVEAFDNDDYLANVAEQVNYALYQLDMYTSARVDAVKAYDEGFDFYAVDADDISLGSKAFTEGIRKSNFGGGYTTWGRWWDSGLTSIGEMLPFMMIPAVNIKKFPKFSKAATSIIKKGGFYTTNVFSSLISDTVKTARLNGIAYEDMNAGQIVGNAALKTVAQYLLEIVTGKIIGFTPLDKMMGIGEDVTSGAMKWFTKAVTAKGAKAVGVALGRGALSMVKEGLEESLQELSDNMIDLVFNKAVDGNMFSSNFSWQNLIDSFVVGALTSGVIGSLSSASVLIDKKSRALAINEDGKAYRLGFFQQLNYNQAMEAMASWQAVLENAKATTQEKADAAFRMQGVALTVGNVLKTFGTERTAKALELLTAYQNKMSTEEQKAEAKLKLSDINYAKEVYSDFVKGNVQVAAKYLNQVKEAKLKKALEKEAKLLKKNGVTKISDIVTQELENTDTTIPEQSVKAVKELMKQTKSDMVIATDGTAVVTSESVIFAPDSLIKTGKVSEILEGIAYDKAIKAIAPELNKKQNDLILEEYQKISGRQDGTIEDALIALLFDKSFYTYILLKTNESQKIDNKNEAIKILAIIDSIVKGKISGDVDKGTLTQAAYQKLVERIQENMRAGLVVYAINYTNIDLDGISAEILPASYKELIRNNKNVIATNTVNKCLESKQRGVITQTRIEEFNRQIDKFIGKNVIINDLIAEAKEKIKSPEYNDRYDACGLLRYLINIDIDVQLTFLKSDMATKAMGVENNTITLVTEFFDADWDSLINGQIKFEELPEDAQEYITKAGYNINNYNDRIAMLRERLYTFSNNTLTVSYNGEVLQILDKNKLVKKEYLGEKGNEKLLTDIQDGKIKKVKDICKITINETIGELDLVLNPNISSNGYFSENNPTRITIAGVNTVNTIMHEATHATQYYIRPDNVTTMSTGASLEHLQNVKANVLNKIERYIEKTFPTTYTAMMQNPHANIPSIIYFNVDGEMQAMCKLTNLIFESGFTWNADKTKIYSPDGKTSWDLELKTNKRKSDSTKKSEDRPLKQAEVANLKNDKQIQAFMKDGYLKNKDGSPIVFYRITYDENTQTTGNRPDVSTSADYVYYSTEPLIAFTEYTDFDVLQGRVCNLKENEILHIDAKNDTWAEFTVNLLNHKELSNLFKDAYSTDDLANYIVSLKKQNKLKNIKALYIENIYEGGNGEQLTNDLIVFDRSSLKRVTTDDNKQFLRRYMQDTIDADRYEDRHNAEYIKEYIENYKQDISQTSESRKMMLPEKEIDKIVPDFWKDISPNSSVYNEASEYLMLVTPQQVLHYKGQDNKAEFEGLEYAVDTEYGKFDYNELQPLEISKLRDGKYQRDLDGSHRAMMALKANIPYLPLLVSAVTTGEDSKNNLTIKQLVVENHSGKTITGKAIPVSPKYYNELIDALTIKDNIPAEDVSQISESRKISNEYARQSNLKYFIKKGQQIQLDERVQQFVINTTDDFDKLEPVIQKAIKAGTMTLQDVRNYIETANSMNDYTFKMIAKYIYENEEVAKLTYKEMIEILEHLEEIDTLKLFLNNSEVVDKKMSYTKMLKAYDKIKEDAKINKKTAEALAGYTNLAGTIKPANSRQFIPYEADIDQLHGAFFRHYNGTIRSVSGLNNLGKNIAHNQEALSLSENEGEGANLKSRKSGAWNWIDRMRKADINYGNPEQLNETLSDLDRQDKINIIQEHIIQSIIEQSKANKWSQEEVLEQFNNQRDKLDTLTDDEINKLYMAATSEGIVETTPDYMNIKTELEKRYVRKNQNKYEGKYASRITARATAKQAGRRVAQKLAGMKTRYNMLPPEVQELFNRKGDGHYELNTKYQDMSDADLETIIPKLQEANKQLAERIRFVEAAKKSKLNAIKRANRQAEKMLDTPIDNSKKTMGEKIDKINKVIIHTEEYDIVAPNREVAPSIVQKVLATGWDKSRTTKVQGLDNNIDQNIANAETFYSNNTDMLNMSVAEAEQAAKWFMDKLLNKAHMTPQDSKKFEAIQLYFLGYVLEETRENGQFADLNNNVKTKIENFLRDKATAAGTALAVWNNIRKRLNPLEVMISQSVVIGGVELTESEQRELFTAAQQGDMETVAKLQQRTLERIKKEAGTKKKFLRRVTAVRSMSMLSSPLTWLRNIVSNFMLKRLNKWSSAIGNKVFTSKGKSGQIKFTGNITPEIQKFINDNFIDNKLFETLVSNISKYNPSEISKKFKNKDGSIDKTAILANMVIKSMYGQYYSENMFKTSFMNKTYQGLMKMMSDNNYVREAAVRYFGKILADKGTDLSKGVTDQIMTDFANAIGIAMADYMHSDNFFNNLERIAADHGELTLFLYKNLLPFMSTSWNWFKAAIRYSPLGLINSIIKLTRIEDVVRKQTSKWKRGEAQVAPEYMEYLIRRDIGSGIIGTMAFGLGILLAALGFIDLDDDDYGVPKLVIPGTGLEVDISSIFGTSSVLAGAALIVDIRDQGLSWDTVLSGLDNMLDVYADGFFLSELMSLDMYAGGGSFATVLDWAESFGLSFIPNGLAWLAGMTYTGTLRKKGFFGKAAAKVPFLAGYVNEKKVDPYTGKDGGLWDMFNRVFPYFDIKMKSRAKETAESLGLSKKELRGQYTINNEEFNLSDKEVSEINKQYGEWNAKDLTAFLDNKEKYKVKDEATGNYKMLTYSQMTDKQRKNTISTIMENNAENAKILAWLNAGYKYYASANKYAELRQLGVKGKLYKGSKGFVKE
jgi:hypothetical protein